MGRAGRHGDHLRFDKSSPGKTCGVTLALTGKRGSLAMRVARGARAHRDIPCIIITVSALAGGEDEQEEEGRRRRRRMGVGRGGISYLFLTGIQDGESRPKDFCVTCRPLPCTRHPRERWISSLFSAKRRRINSRGQPSGMIRRDETAACVWQGEGLRYFSPSSDRHSIFLSAPYSPRDHAMRAVDNEIFRSRSVIRNMISKIWEFVQDEFGVAWGKIRKFV